MENPTETFQNRIIDAVTKAAANDVHPAIVHTVLVGVASDVLTSIKRMNQPPNSKPETTQPTNVTDQPNPA